MKDLDQRLADHFAGIAPSDAFDATLRVRLEAERARLARFDREAALREAMAQRVRQRDREYRERRRTTWSLAAAGFACLVIVAWTSAWWIGLADGIGAGVITGATRLVQADGAGAVVQVLLVTVPALVVVAALRPRWITALRDALLG